MTVGLAMIVDESCWIPTQTPKSDGYVQIRMYSESNKYLHRWMYETLVSPIKRGMYLDHLCRERSCCNPLHLEPVTHKENIRRGIKYFGSRNACSKDHPYTEENTYEYHRGGYTIRVCRACHKLAQRKYMRRAQYV